MIVYKDYISFKILNEKINLISHEFDYGLNTVAEMVNSQTDKFYYLGDQAPNIESAINAWQEVNKRVLSDEEICQIMLDNHL